jgi:predicted nuclease with RNAse H fold
MFQALVNRGLFVPHAEEDETSGVVDESSFRGAPIFETHPDGIFCALQGRRMPAKRHPLGIQRRIEELLEDRVIDEGGELWYRRIEEIEAAAAALAAHRYAVGHAVWVGDPDEGVIVLPGSRLPDVFSGEGVIPPVPRVPLGTRG